MIKFFRHIRKSLIQENKMSKYFKYAIGEIVLVVIGILIALQINNWNEKQNQETKLKQFLVEFKEELKLNIRDFKQELKVIEEQMKLKNNLLVNNRLDTIPLDSLEILIDTRYILTASNPSLLKRFENSQITSYGKYDSIFKDLQNFYGYEWYQFEKLKKWHNDQVDFEDRFWRFEQDSFELKLINSSNAIISSEPKRKEEIIKLLKSPRVRNMLKQDYGRKDFFKRQLKFHIEMAKRYYKNINEILE